MALSDLKNLTSLHLSGTINYKIIKSLLSQHPLPVLPSLKELVLTRVGVDVCEELLSTFKDKDIYLTKLKVSASIAPFSQVLLDYLTAYSGLEELIMSGVHTKDTTLAARVWGEVLEKHQDTLQTLSIVPLLKVPNTYRHWCINLEALKRCRKLRRVDIAVDTSDANAKVRVYPGCFIMLTVHLGGGREGTS
ncbi:hypothetical protein BDZ89DRAFT_176674 [Hymenopellis radicata]|nr:hypothetical protein BDZ89DRAFT_176674 [Hymenopellis radicata]